MVAHMTRACIYTCVRSYAILSISENPIVLFMRQQLYRGHLLRMLVCTSARAHGISLRIYKHAPVQIHANQEFRLFYLCANGFTAGVAVRIDRISSIPIVLSMRRRSCRQAVIAHIDVHIWLRTWRAFAHIHACAPMQLHAYQEPRLFDLCANGCTAGACCAH